MTNDTIWQARDALAAFMMATKAHWGQTRADGKSPYILHPLRVAALVLTIMTMLPFELRRVAFIAAILHDVLEDSGKGRGSTKVTREDILGEFGDEIADVVQELTQDQSLPKAEKRAKMIAHCGEMSQIARVVKLADRLDNMREMKHMPQAFIDRYCSEAKEMLAKMKGSCEPLEAEIQSIIESFEKTV